MNGTTILRKSALTFLMVFFTVFCCLGIVPLPLGTSMQNPLISTLSLVPEARADMDPEILKPTAYTDSAGKTDCPDCAYDGVESTSADIATDADAFPSITYHTWEKPTADVYESLVLYVTRSSTDHADDRWGIKYSLDGGRYWSYLVFMSSKELVEETASVSLDPSQDLDRLQVRIDTDRAKKPDGGYASIHEIWTEGIPYVPEELSLYQSAYRFFANTDSVDLSAIVSDADGVDEATAIATDEEHMYVVGFEPGRWRIEKRKLIDGELVYSKTNDINGDPNAIALDDSYMYIAGDEYWEGNYRWRIEKRQLDTGELDLNFGPGGDGVVTSDPSRYSDSATAIALDLDNACMYVIGSDHSQGTSDSQWRTEIRSLIDGSLLDVITSNPSNDNDIPFAVAIDSDFMYVVGYDRLPGSSNKPGKGKKSQSNPQWRIEKRSLADLTLEAAVTENPTGGFDTAKGIAIDSGYMYVIGSQEMGFFDTAWRIEKRDLGTLSLDGEFGEDGIVIVDIGYDDQPEAIAIDGSHMYIAGYSAEVGGGGDTAWHIEKRSIDDGSLDYARTHDIYDDENDRARAIAIDPVDGTERFMYVAGYANPGLAQWRIEKRSLEDGALNLLEPLTSDQDMPASLSVGERFRLRMLIHVDSGTLLSNGQQFRLQFGIKKEENPPSSWSDVTNGSVIAFFDNPTPSDGDYLMENPEDPSHIEDTTRPQSYEEENGFTNSVSRIEAGQDGLWDFSLYLNNEAPLGTYWFRIVREDDNPLGNGSNIYPELNVSEYPQVSD
jgi:hypothetical protein